MKINSMKQERQFDLQKGVRNMNETVTIEKKVYDVMQKNNLDLMEKLDKAEVALGFYAYADVHNYHQDGGETARKVLKEIGNDNVSNVPVHESRQTARHIQS
jgi:hypothetical protein